MTQADRLQQLMCVWRDPSGGIRTVEEIAAHTPPTVGVTPELLGDVLAVKTVLTEAQCEAVAAFFKVPGRYLSDGDEKIHEQLELLRHLVNAGARSVRLRGKPVDTTRKALLAAVSRRVS